MEWLRVLLVYFWWVPCLLIYFFVSSLKENKANREKLKDYEQIKEKLSRLEKYESRMQTDLKAIFSTKEVAFPYVAAIMSDYLTADLSRLISIASQGTYYQRSTQQIRLLEIRNETSELLKEAKIYEYNLKYLLNCFPNLAEYLDFDDDVNLKYQHNDNKDEDPISYYLSKEEYKSLSSVERNQLALDRYIESHKKSKWQIGRDFELSVGYQYEKKGYKVEYTGETEGLADLGRDLIARKEQRVLIIQCKYWSAEKTIREKHIAQLFGTSICYQVDHPELTVIPLFISSTSLSDEAKSFADKLHVNFVEHFLFKEFPRIKCNIGHDEFGNTKIYHLPMDQQYDSVKINKPGECMVFTVKEAEEKGFRRAYRWHNS